MSSKSFCSSDELNQPKVTEITLYSVVCVEYVCLFIHNYCDDRQYHEGWIELNWKFFILFFDYRVNKTTQ